MQAIFCDCCNDKIAVEDSNALIRQHRYEWYISAAAAAHRRHRVEFH